MKLRYVILLLSLVASSFMQIGCDRKETVADQHTREKILLVGNGGEPISLDPAFGFATKEMRIIHAVFESLLILDPETLIPSPGLATEWEVTSDGLTYTFHLRKNARFSNGELVTAHDFVFAMKRILSPNLNAPSVIFLDDVKNAKKYNSRAIQDFSKVGIKALDDYTLQFNLENQNPFFTVLVANGMLVPLHQKTLEKFNASDTTNTDWLLPENFVGNGPFFIKKWYPNNYIEVEKNPYYWGAENVKLNKIRFFSMATPEDEAFAFCRGKLHVTSNLSSKHASSCAHRHCPYLRSVELNAVDMYAFNTNIPPLDDVRVRQALSMSINRDRVINDIINDVFKTDRKIAHNIIPGIVPGYKPTAFVHENIKKAQKLLADAGYPKGKDFPVLELLVPDNTTHFGIALTIQDMWWHNLHISVKVVKVDPSILYEKLNKKDYQIIRLGWMNECMDPLNILKDIPLIGWNDSDYSKLIESGRKSPDIPLRFKYLAEAEAILINKAPVMPLFFFIHNFLVHPDVQGWQANSAMINYYQFIDLSSDNRTAPSSELMIPYLMEL